MRLEIMRRSDVALRAVRLLADDGGILNAAAIAARLGSTPQFLPQVLGPMVKAGWLASEPGPRGGYRIAVDPSSRSILDLIELIEGPTDDGACVLRGGPCPGTSRCSLHDAWSSGRRALVDGLDAEPLIPRPTRRRHREAHR